MTGAELVRKALLKIGAITKTETMSDDEVNDAISTLNSMVSSWANDSNTVFARTLESFTLVAGDNEYTIGSGQDFDTTRPNSIIDAYVRLGVIDYAMDGITDESYANIYYKEARARPYFYNFTNGYPYAQLKLYPTPDQAYTIFILSEKPLSSFTKHGDVDLPPGWEEALIYNLAIRLAPEYGRPPDEAVIELARASIDSVQRSVMKNRSMDAQPAGGQKMNIFNGWYK